MFWNYLKIALRNIRKERLYSVINIFGLTLGITFCILVYLFIQDEYSFDRFHQNAENIYRIEEVNFYEVKSQIKQNSFIAGLANEDLGIHPWQPMPLGPTLIERIPEIEQFVRVDENGHTVRVEDNMFEESILFVDANFFEVFSFELESGEASRVLSNPNSAVITQEVAERYFPDENPIGKSISINLMNNEVVFTVSGLATSIPSNSSIHFGIAIRIENKPFFERNMERWNRSNTPLFVQLAQGSDITKVTSKLNDFAEERFSESWPGVRERRELPEDAPVMEFQMTNLEDMHLYPAVDWHKVSNPLYSYILAAIGILILSIACINYITLALTRSSARAKEVGIRKASGAKSNQVALQFWGETQLITLLAVVAAIGLAELLIPLVSGLTGKSLAINYFQNFGFISLLIGVTIITGLFAGSYPAILLSRYKPATVLKGTTFRFKPKLTKGLLVVQFSLSVFLIISSVIMYKQMDFVAQKDLGYNKEQLLFINTQLGWSAEGTARMELFRNELQSNPNVLSVSGMAPSFTRGNNAYGFQVGEANLRSYIFYSDEELIPMMGFKLIEGRNFSADRPSDESNSIVVNEALVNELGWDNPIGQLLPWKGRENPSTVIGVVKDFHFQSLESEIQPMLFHMDPEHGGIADIGVKIEAGMIAETLPQLQAVWDEIAPNSLFEYWFLDDAVSAQYSSYQLWVKIMSIASALGIIIACMGLFGLAGLMALNKTKEIGIRKVLGAGIHQIMLLLNREIALLVVLSMIIATPVSWYLMEQWLSDFSYRIQINSAVFILTAIFSLILAIGTVSYHSMRAALANPVNSLKSE